MTDIEISPFDHTEIFVTFDGVNGIDRIYRLHRKPNPTQASFFDSIETIGGNLPPMRVRCIAVDPWVPGDSPIYIGTNRGVWRGQPQTVNGRRTWLWTPYNNGLPAAVDASDLEKVYQTRVLRAATLGRGVYEVVTFP